MSFLEGVGVAVKLLRSGGCVSSLGAIVVEGRK